MILNHVPEIDEAVLAIQELCGPDIENARGYAIVLQEICRFFCTPTGYRIALVGYGGSPVIHVIGFGGQSVVAMVQLGDERAESIKFVAEMSPDEAKHIAELVVGANRVLMNMRIGGFYE